MFANIESRKYFLLLLASLLLAHCQLFGGGKVDETPVLTEDLKKELQAIQANYEPPQCYFAKFDIKATNAQGQSEQAVGTIRADNLKQRMVMEFLVPYIRIELSKIVVRDNRVYVHDKYNRKQFDMPLNQFAVGGMARNSIRLPFTRFQDILYARLPEEVFKGRTVTRKLQGQDVRIAWQKPDESYSYLFSARRLREIDYKLRYQENQQDVLVKMVGAYGKTIFPGKIDIQAARPGGRPERMELKFTYINPEVQCLDQHFVNP